MEEITEDNLEELKMRLKSYNKEDIKFNEPHFTQQLRLREGNKEEVINNILNPDKLMYSYQEKGRYGDAKHCLHFKISNTRTMKIPLIFDNHEKSLYIITYIMSYRKWEGMVKRRSKR